MSRSESLQTVLDHGRSIFGVEFPRRGEERLPWLRARARQGCPLAQRVLSHCRAAGARPAPGLPPQGAALAA